jgi:hypothetical protein
MVAAQAENKIALVRPGKPTVKSKTAGQMAVMVQDEGIAG